MVDFSKLRKEEQLTHLFVPMSALLEIRWLLNKAGVTPKECYMRPWRLVLNHQVPEINDISDAQREEEIARYYGEYAKYVKNAPAVIISHYNVDDLIKALQDTLFGEGDSDYKEYSRARQAEINSEEIPE